MSPRSKREYVESISLRYRNASRNEKIQILNEFCAILGYHRKPAIRVLKKFRRFRKTKTKRPGRTPGSSTLFRPPLPPIRPHGGPPCPMLLSGLARDQATQGAVHGILYLPIQTVVLFFTGEEGTNKSSPFVLDSDLGKRHQSEEGLVFMPDFTFAARFGWRGRRSSLPGCRRFSPRG
jgi:hypothetical protein